MIPIAAWLGKSALMMSPIGGILKSISPKVWLYIGIAALLVAGFLYHQHRAHAFGAAKFKAGYDAAMGDIALREKRLLAQATKEKTATEEHQAAANQSIGKAHDQEVADLRATADDLRVRLRAKLADDAVKLNRPLLPSSATGGNEPAGTVDIGGDQGLVGVPGLELIDAGERCEIDRATLKEWQAWYPKQKAVWDDWLKRTAK